MGEFNLRAHFLRKLSELRTMKEEYYRAPVDSVTKRSKNVQAETTVDETNSAKPWSNCKPQTSHRLESPPEDRVGPSASALFNYYSKQELH